jgi:hypothetical protein
MSSLIRNQKDFWSGIIFLVVGLAAVIIGREYTMGTAGRMGPAYFPTILGWLLALLGMISIVRSLFRPGEPISRFAIKDIVMIMSAVILFGLLIRGAGLFVAVITLVMLSGFASTKFKVLPFLAVAIGLAIFAVLVFVTGLGLPMPIVGPWLRF